MVRRAARPRVWMARSFLRAYSPQVAGAVDPRQQTVQVDGARRAMVVGRSRADCADARTLRERGEPGWDDEGERDAGYGIPAVDRYWTFRERIGATGTGDRLAARKSNVIRMSAAESLGIFVITPVG